MRKNYLKLRLDAPEFFNGKTIEHNGFIIEYNKEYGGEQETGLAEAMKEIEQATINKCHPSRIFNATVIEDNIDLDNLPFTIITDKDAELWQNIKNLGFGMQTKLGFTGEWKDTEMIGYGWDYRIKENDEITLDGIRNRYVGV